MEVIKIFSLKRIKIWYALLIPLFIGCNMEENMEELMHLDQKVRIYDSLIQFGTHKKFSKKINGIKVCDARYTKCKDGEIEYSIILDSLSIPISDYHELIEEIDELGYRSYFRFEDLSLWVKNGSMGHIDGYIITENKMMEQIRPFRLNDQYVIYPGRKIKNGVFYFSGE